VWAFGAVICVAISAAIDASISLPLFEWTDDGFESQSQLRDLLCSQCLAF
jgi:hypothetical protein